MIRTKRPPRLPRAAAISQLRDEIASLKLEVRRLSVARDDAELERDEYVEMYEHAPLPALTVDLAYAIRRANHAAASLLGEALAKLPGRSLRSLVSARERPLLREQFARALASRGVEKFKIHLAPRGVAPFRVQAWARFSDTRRVLELRLLDLRDQERAELEARRLFESEPNAREASAAKDKFIAVLSHELRTPLTPVLVAASALRAKAPESMRATFEMIERNVAAEARMIDDLLDVNRIVRNKMHVQLRTGDVHEIAREALASLQSELLAKRQRSFVELAAQRHFSKLDPLRLRQVLMNLLKNAIKFTPPGGTIHVRSRNSGSVVVLEVEDNGVGIEADAMRHLFDPFTEDRSTTSAGGLGLGLAICKGLLDLQAGTISAHSRGRHLGSRFVVELPTVAHPPPDTLSTLSELLSEDGLDGETAPSVEEPRRPKEASGSDARHAPTP